MNTLGDWWFVALGLIIVALVIGIIGSCCIFIHRVWIHINTPPAKIVAEYIHFIGKTEVTNMDFEVGKGKQ